MNNMDKLAELQSRRASIEAACESANGKNSARERIKLLFDEGSFVEIKKTFRTICPECSLINCPVSGCPHRMPETPTCIGPFC